MKKLEIRYHPEADAGAPATALKKDGTSQGARLSEALGTQYFLPEERGIEDWLVYARALAASLRYDDGSGNTTSWEPFLSWRRPSADNSERAVDLEKPAMDEIIRYLEDPSTLQHDPARVDWLSRPHFVLLVAFLKLLQYPKTLINQFTRRHLDFYYKDVLQFQRQKASMDTVHVVAELVKGVDQFILKQGTLLDAGKGPGDEAITFGVTHDFFLNHARVTSLRSVFVDKETFDVAALSLKYREIVSEDFGTWPAMKLVYGKPEPGDDMPLYPDGRNVTGEFLNNLANANQRIASATEQLGLSVADFKALMAARAKENADAWREVDYWLSEAGKRKKQDPAFSIHGTNASNFLEQLRRAAGLVSPDSFPALEDYHEWITQLETYFMLPAEDAAFLLHIRGVVTGTHARDTKEEDWAALHALLEAAFIQRRIRERREKLHAVRSQADLSEEDRFMEMMQYALGHPASGDQLPAYPQSLDEIHDDLSEEKDSRHEAYLRDELYLDTNDFMFLIALKRKTISADQWPRGYAIVEQAMRQKRRLGSEKPVKSEWYNLYAADDASRVRMAQEGWKPFGREGAGEKAEVGIALEDPILALEEGKRKIVLKLFFESAGFDEDAITASLAADPFSVLLSSDDRFFEVPPQYIALGTESVREKEQTLQVITVTVSLDETVPAINAPTGAAVPWSTGHPVAKLVLKEQKDGNDDRVPYSLYRDLMLVRAGISVTVAGIRKIAIENDNGTLNPRKPFEPFDQEPKVGSRLYLFNAEIARKKIKTLSFGFHWMGAPADMPGYYAGYEGFGKKEFTASLLLGDQRAEHTVSTGVALFSPGQEIAVAAALETERVPYESMKVEWDESGAVMDAERYFILELNDPDFQHAEFLSQVRQNQELKPPYTPRLKMLTIGYTAETTFVPNDHDGGHVYHLHPFGAAPLCGGKPEKFLPAFDDEGTLFVGVEDLQLPGSLSLLFRFADGGADPDLAKPVTVFSYLASTGWKTLNESMILCDTTANLSHSGVIQLSVPGDATYTSALLPAGKCWIRITVAGDSGGINDLVCIRAQGIEAVRAGTVRLASLAAETITDTVEPVPEVRSLLQPYPSFGGRDEEDDSLFYTRISERLRHKQRAVNAWDYERIVLQMFPEIYKVKALPHDADHEEVKVIVIPRQKLVQGRDLFQPRLPQHSLLDIQTAIQKTTSGFATVRVMNPQYQQVKVRVSVRLREGYSEESCKLALNQALQRFLSPWAFESRGEITFGGEIYANTVVNFLENQACVAYILALRFFVGINGEDFGFVTPDPGDHSLRVQAPSPETILVSVGQHEIDIVRDDRLDFDDMRGIGYMKIGLDFKVE